MADNIQATANFKSVVDQVNNIALAYENYAKKAGKVVGANKAIVSSLKDISKSGVPLNSSLVKVAKQTDSVSSSLVKGAGKAKDYQKVFGSLQGEIPVLGSSLRSVSREIVRTADDMAKLSAQFQIVNLRNFRQLLLNGITPIVTVGKEGKRTATEMFNLSKALKAIELSNFKQFLENGIATIVTVGREGKKTAGDMTILSSALKKISDSNFRKLLANGVAPIITIGREAKKTGSQIGVLAQKLREARAASNGSFTGLEKQIASVGKTAKNTASLVQTVTLSYRTFVRRAGFNLLSRGITTLTSGIQRSINVAVEFEKKIAAIRAISQDSQLSFNRWADSIRDVSSEFNLDLLDATQAAYQAISNQVTKGAETFEFLKTASNLAITAQGSMSQSVSALSSVIKSYSLTADDAESISAKLFKTAELGRVPLSSIADTLGSVTILAANAGVSFDEVAASLSTLTIQGVTAANAQTFLRGILTKILKPTEAMKEAVREMGFETAEGALATLKFGGFLEELRKTTSGSTAEFVQLFSRIRAVNGALGLTGDASAVYQANLKGISDSTVSYSKAITLAKESAGRDFQQQLNETSNLLVKFGQTAAKELGDLFNIFGGLANIVGVLGKAFEAGVVGVFTIAAVKLYKALVLVQGGMRGVFVSTQLASTGFLGGARATRVFSVALGRAKLAVTSLSTTMKVALPLFIVLEAGMLAFNYAVEQNEKAIKDNELAEERLAKAKKKNIAAQLKAIELYADNIYSTTDEISRNEVRENNKRLNSLKKTLTAGGKAYEDFNERAIQSASQKLKVFKDEEDQLKRTLGITEDILRTINSERRKLNADIFGKQSVALDGLDSARSSVTKSVLDGTAEDIKTSFEILTDKLNSLIAGSNDQSAINRWRAELETVYNTVEKRTLELRDKDLEAQKRNVAIIQKLEQEKNSRTQIKQILGRGGEGDIFKATSSEEIKVLANARNADLQEALNLAFTGDDQKIILDRIDTFNSVVSSRLFQLKGAELEASKKKNVEELKKQFQELQIAAAKEIDTVEVSKVVSAQLDGILRGLNLTTDSTLNDAILGAVKSEKELTKTARESALNVRSAIKDLQDAKANLDKGLNIDIKKVTNAIELLNKVTGSRVGETFLGNDVVRDTKRVKLLDDSVKSLFRTITGDTNRLGFVNLINLEGAKKILETYTKVGQELKTQSELIEEVTKKSSNNATAEEKRKEIVNETNTGIEKKLELLDEEKKALNELQIEEFKPKNEIKRKKIIEESTTEGSKSGFLQGLFDAIPTFKDELTKVIKQSTRDGLTQGASETVGGSTAPTSTGGGNVLGGITGITTSIEKSSIKIAESTSDWTKARLGVERAEQNLADAKANGSEVLIQRAKDELRIARVTRFRVGQTSSETLVGRANNAAQKNIDKFQGPTDGVGQSLVSLGKVIDGTSRSIDISGLKALRLGVAFNGAVGAVQTFSNLLLAPKQKGLSGREKATGILSSAAAGASAGAPAGPWGVALGAVLGGAIGITKYRQHGGPIYREGGGETPSISSLAKGTDTVPTMLTPGEFVVNARSTDKFYSQLKAMNSVGRYADGGRVSNSTTNVGDINISAQANQSGSVDVRGLGNQLRKEIRRGTLGAMG